jgi:hypothetical protein
MDSVDADQLRSTKRAAVLNIKSKTLLYRKNQSVSGSFLALAFSGRADELSLPGAAVRGGDCRQLRRE